MRDDGTMELDLYCTINLFGVVDGIKQYNIKILYGTVTEISSRTKHEFNYALT